MKIKIDKNFKFFVSKNRYKIIHKAKTRTKIDYSTTIFHKESKDFRYPYINDRGWELDGRYFVVRRNQKYYDSTYDMLDIYPCELN